MSPPQSTSPIGRFLSYDLFGESYWWSLYQNLTCDSIEHDFSLLGGKVDVTNQEVDNLQRWVLDLEGKLVKLATLEAAFDHFTNEHWIPLQAIILSLHDSLCWTYRGDGEPIPDRV